MFGLHRTSESLLPFAHIQKSHFRVSNTRPQVRLCLLQYILYEILGGVFIATLFGLGLAMVTLAWEVFYYKRKESKVNVFEKKELPKKIGFTSKIRKRKGKVTIGDSFKPAVSHISVYPKNDYLP